ncbi:MAG: hypothetical protein GC155_05450 [Alphaproteobacteria bacterium]|nr:hypothetical protein [Alphaproteobacteria bacterium]
MDGITPPAKDPSPAARKKAPAGVLLFVPAALNRGAFITWLKRVHAWTGFWGALMFLVLGISGFLLDHRGQMKIDTGEPREVMSVVLPVDPGSITSQADLGKWAQAQFHLSMEPRAPRGGPGGPRGEAGREGGAQRGERARFMGREVQQAEVWRQQFSGPNGALSVEYTPGANTVKATRSEQNLAGVIKNLHKGVGLSWPWVLFLDSMAGALTGMALTGALLWSRLHGPRLAAIGIVLASLGLALTAAWSNLV